MKYKTVYSSRNTFRFEITNPPPAGTELKTIYGEEVVFDEVSHAGMLACTRKSDGVQQLYFPHYLVVSEEAVK